MKRSVVALLFAVFALAACGESYNNYYESSEEIPGYITIRDRQFSTELTELSLMRWFLEDDEIGPLKYMVNLTSLNLNHNQIADLSPLAGLTSLTELRLLDNESSDLTPLAGLTNLTNLELSLRYFHDTDLTPLMGLTNLTSFRLSLGGIQTDDISALADLTNLTSLDLWHNQISDLTPLAGLTNLRSLDMSFNQISDISPLSGLINLRALRLASNQISDISVLSALSNLNEISLSGNPIADLTLLDGIPPRVMPPALSAANPHLFADALAGFFVNLTTAPYFSSHMPYSYHAVLVDVDGSGTSGMVASKWFVDERHHSLFIDISPRFAQRLFFIYDDQLHEVDGSWGVTPSGRLVAMNFIGACDILMTEYILLDVAQGRLIGVKSISITELTWGDNYYSTNYHINEFLVSDFESRQPLTHEQFDEMMAEYGLHNTAFNLWELPNNTYKILSMSIE